MSMADNVEPPISSKTLISKLCFVRYGGGLETHRERLQTDLARFLVAEGAATVTRPTIRGWLRPTLPSKPARIAAFIFLRSYLASIEYQSLDQNRKKVHEQISRFLNNQIPEAGHPTRHGRVYSLERDQIGIDAAGTTAAGPRLGILEGTYLAYHARLTEDYKGQFTQEVLRVWKKGRSFQFDLWYLKDGQHVERYTGSVFLFGTMLWLIGATLKSPDRLRMMVFRDIHSAGKKYTDLRCGLMLSDIPTPSSPDPVACRIVLYRYTKQTGDIFKFVKDNVRNFKRDELLKEREAAIVRLIDNAVTALSTPLSIAPATNEDGGRVIDNVLKVDQHTIDIVSNYIFDI